MSPMETKGCWIALVMLASFLSPAMAQFPSNPPDEDTTRFTQADEHRAGSGFLLINKPKGTLIFSPFATLRCHNQKGLDDTYTDSFGRTTTLNKRNDIQLQKVTLYFKGWIDNPKFRYFLYLWSANANSLPVSIYSPWHRLRDSLHSILFPATVMLPGQKR